MLSDTIIIKYVILGSMANKENDDVVLTLAKEAKR